LVGGKPAGVRPQGEGTGQGDPRAKLASAPQDWVPRRRWRRGRPAVAATAPFASLAGAKEGFPLWTGLWMGWLRRDAARRAHQPAPGHPITRTRASQSSAASCGGGKVRKKRAEWLTCGARASAKGIERRKRRSAGLWGFAVCWARLGRLFA
jgi:hypothetical protein